MNIKEAILEEARKIQTVEGYQPVFLSYDDYDTNETYVQYLFGKHDLGKDFYLDLRRDDFILLPKDPQLMFKTYEMCVLQNLSVEELEQLLYKQNKTRILSQEKYSYKCSQDLGDYLYEVNIPHNGLDMKDFIIYLLAS